MKDINLETPLKHVEDTLLSKNSVRSYMTHYKKWRTFAEAKNYSVIPAKENEFLEFLDHLVEHERTKRTIINVVLYSMISIHKYNNLKPFEIPTLDLKKLRLKALQQDVETRNGTKQSPALYLSQVIEIVEEDDVPLRAQMICSLMFDCMLRATDLTHVEWQDIYATKNKDGVVEAYVKIYKTKGKYYPDGHSRYISTRTLNLLNEYCSINKINRQVGFEKTKIYPFKPRQVHRDFQMISHVMGYKVKSHSCRVGGAVEMEKAGVPLTDICNVAGWSDFRMVQYYTRNKKVSETGMATLIKKREKNKITELPDFLN